MSKSDRGATLIEVVMAIVLLGILVPAIYTVILNIDRSMQRSHTQEQVYQIAMRAVEQVKIEGKAGINKAALSLPAEYDVDVKALLWTDPDVVGVTKYMVTVKRDAVVALTYTFYY